MKKVLHFFLCFLLCAGISVAQTTRYKGRTPVPVKSPGTNQPTLLTKPVTGQENFPACNGIPQERNPGIVNSSSIPVYIGNTTYDLQTNYSVCNRIYQLGGNIGTTWTYSTDLSGVFPDRGTAHNYFDGLNWGALPTNTIDTLSWSNIDIGSANTEFVVGHNRNTSVDDLILMKRTPAGTGTWVRSVIPPHPGGHFCLWPRMRVGGANGQTIHVIALTRPVSNGGILNNNMDGALSYCRSQDGGLTWDIVHTLLPMIDDQHYFGMSADSYTIDVRGNTVAIVQGFLYNDWVLWKSLDNGTTWTRTVIMPFPIPAYDQNTMITDVNGDAVPDTIDHIDGSLSVLIDNNNNVHCWAGRMVVFQDTPGSISFFKNSDGILYWNENFGGSQSVLIAVSEDIDGSGTLEFPLGLSGYNLSLTSMPTAGIDGSQNIILVYSGIVENTTNGNPDPSLEQSFRNLFAIISPDNGNSWSLPVRIYPDDFIEQAFPSIARSVGPHMHVVCQEDPEPGTSLQDADPYGANDIVYYEDDPQIIFSGVTIIPYNFYTLKGHVFYDSNQNGIKDGGDYGMVGMQLHLMPNNITYHTNLLGNYLMTTDSGMRTISPIIPPNWTITSDSLSYTVVTDTTVIENLDFGFYSSSQIYDVNTTLTCGIPRCNNSINYWVTIQNLGTVQTSGTVRFIKDNQLVYSSASPPYTTASADTFSWDFVNLLPFESRQFVITLTSFGLNIGDTIFNCARTEFDDGGTGGVSEDCQTQYIICSYDPNDKAVEPEGVGVPHYALLSDTLIYTIRFQNTGNDTAFAVKVRDTLDAFLDVSTFRLLASSHPVNVLLYPGGIVLFDFPNILLPDSNTNLIGSNGFVKYSVEPVAGLPIGTEIYNTAHIFFDYNPAIVTNTTMNTLVDVIGFEEIESDELDMIIYPNPVAEDAYLRFSNTLTRPHTVVVTDITGRAVIQKGNITGDEIKLKSSSLSRGMYLCTLYNESGIAVAVVKMTVR